MQGEYRGDFTRDTFHQANRYCRVLMQQGRVQLDADWNEQTSILLHFVRRLGRDLIGQHGGAGNAFEVVKAPRGLTSDFVVVPGAYYVDGILCENALEMVPGVLTAPNTVRPALALGGGSGGQPGSWISVLRRSDQTELFRGQIDTADATAGTFTVRNPGATIGTVNEQVIVVPVGSYRTQPFAGSLANLDELTGPYLVYLDVWERHITAVQDDDIREVALGGPDTASRSQIVWQIRIETAVPHGLTLPLRADAFTDVDWLTWTALWQSAHRGRLKARVQPHTVATDPCLISPRSSYRGAENQLYRVEIHRGTPAPNPDGTLIPATYKWSRENGSVVFSILQLATAAGQTTVTLANLGRDRKLSLKVNDWVEVVDDASSLAGTVDGLMQVVEIDHAGCRVTLNGTSAIIVAQPVGGHPLLRRWEGTGTVTESGTDWIALEDGVEVQFQPADGGPAARYRSGDYWLIPARVATGDIEWPRLRNAQGQLALDGRKQPLPVAQTPHGVEHHYAPLATISATKQFFDQRRTFTPLAT